MNRGLWLGALALGLGALSARALNAQNAAPAALRYQIAFATYLGGAASEEAREALVCPDGSILVSLVSPSANLPTSEGAVCLAAPDPRAAGYLARLSPDGTKVVSATYLWGRVHGLALDGQGNIVVAGVVGSASLPATPGCFQVQFGGGEDVYVAKLSPDMKKVVWATYLGGSGGDSLIGGIALDGQGNIYLAGSTQSPIFPTTPGAVQSTRKGPSDAFAVALTADGSGLLASTLLGGGDGEGCMGVGVGPGGDIFVGGSTSSTDFPTTPGAFQAGPHGQSECFMARLSAKADRLVYSTYLGGSGNEWAEPHLGLLPDGSALLTGVTLSPDYPSTPGALQTGQRGPSDGFLARLAPDGKGLIYSTLLGGSDRDFHSSLTPDAAGNVFLVGNTQSRDYPTTPGCVQAAFAGGASDAVLSVVSPDGAKLLYSTLLGGSDKDTARGMALGPNGEVVVVGRTASPNFPVSPNALQVKLGGGEDAFVIKLVPVKGAAP